MALIQINMYSSALTTATAVNVVIPLENNEKEKYPVLWLLPPSGLDHTAWQRRVRVERLAEKYGIIAAMPNLALSYGLDMAHGLKYFTMLDRELPALLKEYFPVDLTRQYIAGAGEGGYAALRTALLSPEHYKGALSLSCGSLTDEIFEDEERKRQILNAFGTRNIGTCGGTDFDLGHLMDREEKAPELFLAYGDGDPLEKSCALLAARMEAECVKKLHGPASWEEWEEALDWFMRKVFL